MKIFAIIQCSNLGGMEKAALESLVLLKNEGHRIKLYSLHPVGDLGTLADREGVPLEGSVKYRLAGLGNIRKLVWAIRQFAPDRVWIIGHNYGALLAGRISHAPMYMSIHYHHGERPRWFWFLFYALARRYCTAIHFVSRFIFDEVSSLFSERDHVHCFTNVLRAPAISMTRNQARAALGIDQKAFVVGNAGWLIPRKAFDVFLEVAARVHRDVHGSIYLIAGDGPERQRLEQKARSLELGDAVRFLGWQSDLVPFYRALDVLLFNSNFDCLGMTPLEALMHEVPIVCSVTRGGLKEIIRHGQDGFLIDRHDRAAMAGEIVRMYNDPESRAALAECGRNHVLEWCAPERHLENLNAFLEL